MGMSPAESTKERILRRVPGPCAVPGCMMPTHMLCQFCWSHEKVNRRHGHPQMLVSLRNRTTMARQGFRSWRRTSRRWYLVELLAGGPGG
jgi:hypothetical protein